MQKLFLASAIGV